MQNARNQGFVDLNINSKMLVDKQLSLNFSMRTNVKKLNYSFIKWEVFETPQTLKNPRPKILHIWFFKKTKQLHQARFKFMTWHRIPHGVKYNVI